MLGQERELMVSELNESRAARHTSIKARIDKSRSSAKSSLMNKSRGSIPGTTSARELDAVPVNAMKKEYKLSQKVTNPADKRAKLSNTIIKQSILHRKNREEEHHEAAKNNDSLFESLKNFEIKRKREKETFLSIIQPNELKSELHLIESNFLKVQSL
jgi:hypothetical protein